MPKTRKRSRPDAVPAHPKHCPLCRESGISSKVRVYRLNQENDAIFMCSNLKCPWPLTTHEPHEIMGKEYPSSVTEEEKNEEEEEEEEEEESKQKTTKDEEERGREEGLRTPDFRAFILPTLLSPLPSSSPSHSSSSSADTEDVHRDDPVFSRKRKVYQTESSESVIELNSLSNRVSMNLGQTVSLKVLSLPEPDLRDKIETLKNQIPLGEDDNEEFNSIMKMASTDHSKDFLHKIQKALKMEQEEVVFHVATSLDQSTIDLSTSALDVSSSPNGVKVKLSSDSNGIEKDSLRDPSPHQDEIPRRPRGRKPGAKSNNLREGSNTPSEFKELSANPELVENFRYHLSVMMRGFEMPPEWENQGIDPVVAMLVIRKRDPNYLSIDTDAMLQLYAKILRFETYLEKTNKPLDPSPSKESLKSSSLSPLVNVKCEIIEDESAEISSVEPLSVHSSIDGSVQYVPERFHQTNGEKIGRGKHLVTFDYEKSHFGPIYVESEKEVRAVVDMVEEKIADIKNRKSKTVRYTYSSAAERAKSLLPVDIVKYIHQAFTVKGLKKSIVGRKSKNYPKRSEIIKIDKETGQHVYPPNSTSQPKVSTLTLESVEHLQTIETLSDINLERNVFSNEIPKVDQSNGTNSPGKNIEASSPSNSKNKRAIITEESVNEGISDMLGKTSSKIIKTASVSKEARRPLIIPKTNTLSPSKRQRIKVTDKKSAGKAIGATSMYVRPSKKKKVIKLLDHKEKKLCGKPGVYKGFNARNEDGEAKPEQSASTPTTKPSLETRVKSKNKPEVSKEEQDLMLELLKVADELDAGSKCENGDNFGTSYVSKFENSDMPNLDDLF